MALLLIAAALGVAAPDAPHWVVVTRDPQGKPWSYDPASVTTDGRSRTAVYRTVVGDGPDGERAMAFRTRIDCPTQTAQDEQVIYLDRDGRTASVLKLPTHGLAARIPAGSPMARLAKLVCAKR